MDEPERGGDDADELNLLLKLDGKAAAERAEELDRQIVGEGLSRTHFYFNVAGELVALDNSGPLALGPGVAGRDAPVADAMLVDPARYKALEKLASTALAHLYARERLQTLYATELSASQRRALRSEYDRTFQEYWREIEGFAKVYGESAP